MILTLEVTGPQAQELGAGARKVFKAIGGTIGRLPDNDWVFPDPYVSGRHALIRYVNAKFFVEDTSTNGVFINTPDKRLTRGQPQQLHDGDLLYIDAYQINVSIQKDGAADTVKDPFAGMKPGATKLTPPPARRSPPASVAEEDGTASLAVLRPKDERHGTVVQGVNDGDEEEEEDEEDSEDGATEWYGGAEMANSKKSLSPVRGRPEIVKSTVPIPPPQTPVPKPPPAVVKAVPSPTGTRPRIEPNGPPPASDTQLKTLLDAAGINGLDPTDETARTLGEILRIALGGVMEALRTRERMKDDLRMRGTTFKAADNNPLKFSANIDDAFHNLLVKHNPAYLEPAAAFEEAFHDVRDHHAALEAAMRMAFESMLAQFDPQRLQEELDRQMKGSIIGVPAKLRYWDLYRGKYAALIKDGEAAFRTLFGEAFAHAYEEHLERLKKTSRPLGQ